MKRCSAEEEGAMNTDPEIVGRSGLHFFGRMCASISHDIKNVLAVVNENAGLVEDLCFAAERGKPLDPLRLKRVAADVKAQIRRGDVIISGMNRFAHSVDSESVPVNLPELIELLAALCSRFAAMRGLTLQIARSEAAATVTTSPFLLLNLLWLCLEQAMAAAGPERTVALSVEKTTDGACLRFRKLEGLKTPPEGGLFTEPAASLCCALNAEVRADVQAGEIVVQLAGGRQ
jgi:C4-dicarboxylate-specific signal transduction histidine kinase